MITPTNGRVVIFHPSTAPQGCSGGQEVLVQLDPKQPLAAMISHVHGNRMVNLTVFDSLGKTFDFRSVTLLQDDDRKPEGGFFCTWMPYQIGQAAKTEKLQAELDSKFPTRAGA